MTKLACRECDLLAHEVADAEDVLKHQAYCPRCGSLLRRHSRNGMESALALACSGIVLLLVVNAFPVVGLDIHGQRINVNLIGAAIELWQAGSPSLAGLVLLTTNVMPLLEMSAVIWLIFPLLSGRRPPGFKRVFRVLQGARAWAMVEVFSLGILIALVKLAHVAEIWIAPAMLSFAALMLVHTAMNAVFEPSDLWRAWQEAAE